MSAFFYVSLSLLSHSLTPSLTTMNTLLAHEHTGTLPKHLYHCDSAVPRTRQAPAALVTARKTITQIRRWWLHVRWVQCILCAYMPLCACLSHTLNSSPSFIYIHTQLLSILRLSQALARLRLSSEISHEDVDEAMRCVSVCVCVCVSLTLTPPSLLLQVYAKLTQSRQTWTDRLWGFQ